MTLKKWLIACCFGLMVSVVQAVTQEEQLELAETYNAQVIQYFRQGQLEQALPLAKKAFIIRAEILGKHPYTLESLNNWALIYQALGHFEKALPLLEKGYSVMKEFVDKKHQKSLMMLGNLAVNLAVTYRELERFDEALPLFEEGYFLKKEVLGEKHPKTLKNIQGLAGIYRELGRLDVIF